jgi:hypothetical protein
LKRAPPHITLLLSKKHLPLYLAEFDHRFNHRKSTDGERTFSALKRAERKRLTLKPLKKSKNLHDARRQANPFRARD